MENRLHLYVTRKNPAVWLMLLCLLASVGTRVMPFVNGGMSGIWPGLVLPVAAVIIYALIVIISGEQMLYKTAIPIWLMGIGYAWRLFGLLKGSAVIYMMVCVCILFACVIYTSIISGRWRWPWLLVVMYLGALAVVFYIHRRLSHGQLPVRPLYYVLPDYLLISGMMILQLGIRVHADGQYHPTWGDRAEGRRVRTLPPMAQIESYIMVNRTGASNQISEAVEITQLDRFIRKKRREGMLGLGLTHVIVAAYVRTIAKYPGLNRFIAGQKVYTRGEDIALSMVVKKEMTVAAPDTAIKVHLNPHDTLSDVFRKFNEKVEEAKNTPLDSGMDNTAAVLTCIPGLLLKFTVWLLKTMDYFGLLPAFLLEISPFHASAFFTSMGSLGIRPVYHHLYDFGTIPTFCAFGKKRRACEIVDGEVVERKYMDIKFNLDDRTCDGFYYATALKYFLRLLRHPEILDQPPETVEQDIP